LAKSRVFAVARFIQDNFRIKLGGAILSAVLPGATCLNPDGKSFGDWLSIIPDDMIDYNKKIS
jgi:hypothetical protein